MPLPYYITRDSLLEHALVRGGSGTGKTALILTPLIEQLIGGKGKNSDSVVVMDLKGDPAQFRAAGMAAKKAGVPFKWFTLDKGRATFGMNPFLQSHFSSRLSINEGAAMMVKAMGLDFGDFYGATYFRDMAQLFLRSIMDLGNVESFVELSEYAKKTPSFLKLNKQVTKETSHLSAVLDDLASVHALNVHPNRSSEIQVKNMIDMNSLLHQRQVIYFYLKSTLQSLIADAVAKLAAYSLLTAAALNENKQTNRVFLVVDEFHRIVSQEMCLFLQQSRSLGIGCVLSTQTTADLNSPAGDFRDVIEESTNAKIDLSANSPEQAKRLMEESPEVLSYQKSFSFENKTVTDLSILKSKYVSSSSETLSEVAQHSIGRNDLKTLGADRQMALVRVRTPDGLTQLGGMQVPVRLMYHISKEEYQRRTSMPWPKTNTNLGMLENTNEPITKDIPVPPKPRVPRTERVIRKDKLFEQRANQLTKQTRDEI